MKRRSIKKNAILNALRSLIAVIFPIITYPYAARVVGVEHLGRGDYVAHYIEFFMLFATKQIETLLKKGILGLSS